MRDYSTTYIVSGCFIVGFAAILLFDSFQESSFFHFVNKYEEMLLGILLLIAGFIFVGAGMSEYKKIEHEKVWYSERKYPMISVGVGIFSMLFGMLFFLDGWGRYSLYPLVSQTVKQDILLEILFGLFFVVVGIVLMIKGFIDYAKCRR